MSGGEYVYMNFNATKSRTKCLPYGHYEFQIFDEAGDGLCCTHGQGLFRVLVGGVEIARGASFFERMAVPVPVDASALEDSEALDLPASVLSVEINFDSYPEENEWEVVDEDGAVVMSGRRGREQVLFPGLYRFRMYDSFADGMCCEACDTAAHDGKACGYKLLVDGKLVATGGDFNAGFDERWFTIAEQYNPECYKLADAADCTRQRGLAAATNTSCASYRCQAICTGSAIACLTRPSVGEIFPLSTPLPARQSLASRPPLPLLLLR